MGDKYILGVPNFANYESSAALIRIPEDGSEISYICIGEDRLTRLKQTYTFPLRGINYCLQEMGLDSLEQIDWIATDYARLPRWINSGPAYRKVEHDYLKLRLKYPTDKIRVVNHHDAHAASCFYPSGFQDAAILVIDGMGSELETQSLYHGVGRSIRLIERGYGWGIGKLYSLVTGKILPYGPEKGFGKVMGLAPYGEKHEGPVLHFDVRNEGMTTDYSSFYSRQPISRLIADGIESCSARTSVMQPYFLRCAYDIQRECEDQLIRMAEYAYAQTGSTRLCLAGGVILNGRANHLIIENTPITDIWMPPCVSDTGIPFGLALWGAFNFEETPKGIKVSMPHAYTGRDVSTVEIVSVLDQYSIAYEQTNPERVASLIADGNVVAWFDGASEFGPRALGHRSILADPRSNEMKDKLNAGVKFREAYRPYAPSVLKEHARDWFNLQVDSPFMLQVCTVKEEKRTLVPAITHIDGTARIQEVSREHSPGYWSLIEAFREQTGVPMLLNTSFNVNREPIVETPSDALFCAFRTKIDYLVFNGTIAIDCRNYRAPELSQTIDDDRKAADKALYESLIARLLTHYDRQERDQYIENENRTATWYLTGAARLNIDRFVLDAKQKDARVLVIGTPGHTQVLYEYIPGMSALNIVGCIELQVGRGEPGTWPKLWPLIKFEDVDWPNVDIVLVSTHEYQREVEAVISKKAPETAVCRIYDTAMDSLYFTLPQEMPPLTQSGTTLPTTVRATSADETTIEERPGVSITERYGFVINYHFVRPGETPKLPGLKGVTPESFRSQVRTLFDNFQFVTAGQFVDPTRDLAESSAILTFDDSLRDVTDYAAPVMAEFGIVGTVFVPTTPYAENRVLGTQKRQLLLGKLGLERFSKEFYSILERVQFSRQDFKSLGIQAYPYDTEQVRQFKLDLNYAIPHDVVDPILDTLFANYFGPEKDVVPYLYLSRDDLLRLQDKGWEIGGHSHRHQVMSLLTPIEQEEDVQMCFDFISQFFEISPTCFAYPFGGQGTYTTETIEAVRKAGFKAGFTIGRQIVKPSDLKFKFSIPRFDVVDLFDKQNVLNQEVIQVLSTGD